MKKLLYLCLFPFLGISCMDDLGTYDYNPLHEINLKSAFPGKKLLWNIAGTGTRTMIWK